MKQPNLALFGIPLFNNNIDVIIQECLDILEDHKQNSYSFYIDAINHQLITNIYGLTCTSLNHPELNAAIRKINIATTPDPLLIRLSSLLGSPLNDAISSDELLAKLCEALGKREKGVFILGGTDRSTKHAAVTIRESSPQLRIVGIATPPIFTSGEDLTNARERDDILIEQINNSNAELLIVNLGSSKQALWIERVRPYLKTPLILSVGDALERVNKTNKPLPEKQSWFQRFVSRCKMMLISIPLVIFHNINRFIFRTMYNEKLPEEFQRSQLFLSPNQSIAVIPLPPILDKYNVQTFVRRFDEASIHDVIVFDFRKVRHIQPEGFSFLIDSYKQRREGNKKTFAYRPTSDIKSLIKLHRTWDLVKNHIVSSSEMLMARIAQNNDTTTFYDSIYQQEELIIISFFGALDNTVDYEAYIKKLIPTIGLKNCILDFSFCTSVDNTGFAFLLTLRKRLLSEKSQLTLRSVSRKVRKQFLLAKVDSLFSFI